MIGGDTITITDYKHGKGVPVSAESNTQMMLYALGALKKYSAIYWDSIKKVRLCICQPRIHAEPSIWETTVEELTAWGESIKPIAEKAFMGLGEFVPGEHCRFCRGKARCKARADVHTAAEEFKDFALPNKAMPGQNTLTHEQIGDLLVRCKDLVSREYDAQYNKDYMTIQLPSGRKLYYNSPQLGENRWGNPSISYMGMEQTKKKWTRIETYGGKLVENVVQAIARDCLTLTIERVEAAGYRDHAYENMVSKERAEKDGRPTTRGGKPINFHNLGVETMTEAMASIEHPSVVVADEMSAGNPAIIMVLPVFDETGTPLCGVVSFYSNRSINGSFSTKPHILLTIHRRDYIETNATGRQGLVSLIAEAIEDGRIIDFDSKKIRADLPVIAQRTRLGNITAKALVKNLAHFHQKVKDFREKNDILYSERETAPTFYSLMDRVIGDMKQDKIGAASVVPYL